MVDVSGALQTLRRICETVLNGPDHIFCAGIDPAASVRSSTHTDARAHEQVSSEALGMRLRQVINVSAVLPNLRLKDDVAGEFITWLGKPPQM